MSITLIWAELICIILKPAGWNSYGVSVLCFSNQWLEIFEKSGVGSVTPP